MFRFLNNRQMHGYSKCKVLFPNINTEHLLNLPHRYKSHYTALGLEPSASPKDIKSAYYELSLKHHPDKNQGSVESAEKFREITEAYEILCNPEKKRIYDRDINVYPDREIKNDFYWRSNYYKHATPRTGRTEYYNYDEHYKQHYEEYFRRRETEQEHFKRRWRADHRYRYGDQYTRSSGFSSEGEYRERSHRRGVSINKAFLYFLTLWIILIVAGEMSRHINPENKKKSATIYYRTKVND